MMKYFLSSPDLNESDYLGLKKLFEPHQEKHVNQPALEFEALLDATYQSKSLLLQSGTVAFQLIAHLFSFEVVFCQNLTFVASIAPFVQKGAKPVFLGSGTDWNIDEIFWDDVDRTMQSIQGTAAVVITHLYGNPAKAISSWHVLKEKYGDRLILIEDAAEAVGSTLNGKPLGTFGDFGVLSFNRNKIITTSGGGALLMNGEHAKKYEYGFHLATQAREQLPYYQHHELGFNWRMGDLNAQMGISQWKQLPQKLSLRRRNFQMYFQELHPEFSFQPETPSAVSNRWITAIHHPNLEPEKAVLALKNEGIESRMIWKPMHLQPIFKGATVITRNVETELFQTGICLPSGSNLNEEAIFYIIQRIKNTELT
jgi:dTDP-4-amino-4,6-dideoxygalactose transaminase